ncbi:M20/M25/M40 family metallo-hydrolase [Massilia sp. TS11]|uniref:M20/M25/M40 family metallo-hydrolase n=1 Tax=Massilia sp. TS11 TaxID=2908003 RepID=UPI001EDB08F4|nr:M20/M25/M40 family metallo-hydrolase [Massilia sp. TS11]MCG2585049.1 M20/M25/M40 family metallo-hydrolase [Massilia sp. TS11]
MKKTLLALLAATCLQPAFAADLSPTEQAIVAAVKANNAQGLALLEKSVNINSGTMNHAGVRAVGALFRQEFDALGFQTRWSEMPAAMQRAGHLIAEREGKQGKRLLLIGHLDTVFEKDSPVQLWERHGDRVRGQGVSDMKGGDVIIIQALKALKQAGALDNTTIRVVFTGDEEDAGSPKEIARKDLIDAARRSDLALAFEGTSRNADGKDTATIGRRSSSSWVLEVKGKQGHSSAIFRGGYGAIYEAARILDAFRREVPEPDLTFSPGLILGGTEVTEQPELAKGSAFGKTNVIPNSVVVHGDMRYLDYAQRDRARAKMSAIAAQNLAGTSATIRFHDSYPPMSPTEGNRKLLAQYSQASIDAGLGEIVAVPPGLRGAGDVAFVAPLIDSLDGMGAAGNGAHSPNEDLDIPSIERSTIRTALMIYRLTR